MKICTFEWGKVGMINTMIVNIISGSWGLGWFCLFVHSHLYFQICVLWITYLRKYLLLCRCEKPLTRLHVTYEGTIEGNGLGMLQVGKYQKCMYIKMPLARFLTEKDIWKLVCLLNSSNAKKDGRKHRTDHFDSCYLPMYAHVPIIKAFDRKIPRSGQHQPSWFRHW